MHGRDAACRREHIRQLNPFFVYAGVMLDNEISNYSRLAKKLAENDLEENRRFLADLIEYSGILIAVKNLEGCYEMVNRKWEEVTGLSRHDVLGKSDEELFAYPFGRQLRATDLEVIESGRYIEKEETIDDEKLGRRYGISTKFPVKGKDGNVRGVCVMSTDITDRKRAEERA